MELLKSQRNEVLKVIGIRGFDPAEFRWDLRGVRVATSFAQNRSEQVPQLIHQPTQYAAVFNISSKPWTLVISPGEQSTAESVKCLT